MDEYYVIEKPFNPYSDEPEEEEEVFRPIYLGPKGSSPADDFPANFFNDDYDPFYDPNRDPKQPIRDEIERLEKKLAQLRAQLEGD